MKIFPEDRFRHAIQIKNRLLVNLLAEFTGMFIFIFIGLCISMQFFLGKGLTSFIHINLGWGFALTFCAHFLGGSSGGHLNPAISLLMATFGRIPLLHVPLYATVHTIAGFLAAFCAYFFYWDQFDHFSGSSREISGENGTGLAFCSFPEPYVTHVTAFVDQVIGTACLTFFVAVLIDRRNKIPVYLHPLYVGFVLFMIGCGFALNVGYPINPARDLGPRLFAYFVYGSEVFSYHNYYFWIPIVAPFIGSPFGGWFYHLLIGAHIPDDLIEDFPKKH